MTGVPNVIRILVYFNPCGIFICYSILFVVRAEGNIENYTQRRAFQKPTPEVLRKQLPEEDIGKGKPGKVQALRLCTGCTAHRGSRGIALTFHDHGTRRRGGVSVTPRPLFTPGKDPIPIDRSMGRPQGRYGQVQKISMPPGFDPRIAQPVASRYTVYATRPTSKTYRHYEVRSGGMVQNVKG